MEWVQHYSNFLKHSPCVRCHCPFRVETRASSMLNPLSLDLLPKLLREVVITRSVVERYMKTVKSVGVLHRSWNPAFHQDAKGHSLGPHPYWNTPIPSPVAVSVCFFLCLFSFKARPQLPTEKDQILLVADKKQIFLQEHNSCRLSSILCFSPPPILTQFPKLQMGLLFLATYPKGM